MDQMIIPKLSALVKDPQLEELELILSNPNIFNILRISNREIRHSNFLAWLLNPQKRHSLNTIVLKWFLREVFSSDKTEEINEFELDLFDLTSTQVERESHGIDILIVHDSFVVAIENKLFSGEHSRQLKRYREYCEKTYPDLVKVYVYLTIDGYEPVEEDDARSYITVSYSRIRSIIDDVVKIYSDSIPEKIKTYIYDYMTTLTRYIVKDHESVELALKLYKSHSEAIDFIIENKPDRLNEIRTSVESVLKEENDYEYHRSNKAFARFLPKELEKHMPNTGRGWNGEAMLLEIWYSLKDIAVTFVIAPGNDHNRSVFVEILEGIQNLKRNKRSTTYIKYSKETKKVDFLADKYDDTEEIKSLVRSLLKGSENEINVFKKRVIARTSEFQRG